MSREIVIASGNAHKVAEFRTMLEPLGFCVLSAADLGGMPEVVEDGATFADNAVIKAVAGARHFGRAVLADDSGLEVFALQGAPGVRSARFAGEPADDRRNLEKLLRCLEGCRAREARFVCALALARADTSLAGTAWGEVRGRMAETPSGRGGFGYDPAFIPDGYAQTFGELSGAEKNRLSHRRNALDRAIADQLFTRL